MVQSHGCSNTKFPTVRPCITRLLFKLLFDDHLFTRSHGRFTQRNRSARTNMRNHRRPLYQPALSVSLSKNTQQRDRHTTRTNNDCSRGNICATGSSGFVSGVLRSSRNTRDGVIFVIFSIFQPCSILSFTFFDPVLSIRKFGATVISTCCTHLRTTRIFLISRIFGFFLSTFSLSRCRLEQKISFSIISSIIGVTLVKDY